jgi:hypothetical protein
MMRRIVALFFIFGCTTVGWVILGGVTNTRTYDQDETLQQAVWHLWGTFQQQQAPTVRYRTWDRREVTRTVGGATYTEAHSVPVWHPVPLEASDIQVDLSLAHRRKGLLWYSTYQVRFRAEYRVVNRADQERELHFDLVLPSQGAVYDDFRFAVGGQEIDRIEFTNGTLSHPLKLGPGEKRQVSVSYQTRGLDEWHYVFGSSVTQVKNFRLEMNTDFPGIDFAPNSMSPGEKERTQKGWRLAWRYSNMLSGVQIGMVMPRKLNPGPWAAKVTFFAPVSLFFFFFLLFILTTVKAIKVHPMNYFFLGAAFFSFHLLLSYLVDHISLHLAFMLCSMVSIFLVVSYMRLVVGARFALVEVGVSQFVSLVVFSYTFFFKGYTGLSVTIMSIVTLFVVMQYTGRLDWEKVFRDAGERLEAAAQ